MREIKFRAWDTKRKVIEPVEEIDWQESVVLTVGYSKVVPFRDAHLMQYTELKDKNGVEIYEGDVLAYWGLNRNGPIRTHNRVVEWRVAGLTAGWNIGMPRSRNGGERINRREVIGNIYENPELLEAAA